MHVNTCKMLVRQIHKIALIQYNICTFTYIILFHLAFIRMKNLLLAITFSVTSFYSIAQQQIPNGDFENWVSSPYCFGLDSADNFLTGDAFTYLNAKKNTGSGTCPGSPNYKSGDSQSGAHALTISARYIANQPNFNFVTLGNANDFGGLFGIGSEGVPFTGQPTKLTGYYKLNTTVTTDELKISVSGENANSSSSGIFYGIFTTLGNQDLYKKFEINLAYNPSDPSNPTTLKLVIAVGNGNDNSMDENTIAFIDNLVFEYDNTATSTLTYTTTSPINVYAANKNINFSENVSDVHVVDMVGSQKMQEALTTKTLNAASLTAGMYIITYKYNDAYYSKKVVIE